MDLFQKCPHCGQENSLAERDVIRLCSHCNLPVLHKSSHTQAKQVHDKMLTWYWGYIVTTQSQGSQSSRKSVSLLFESPQVPVDNCLTQARVEEGLIISLRNQVLQFEQDNKNLKQGNHQLANDLHNVKKKNEDINQRNIQLEAQLQEIERLNQSLSEQNTCLKSALRDEQAKFQELSQQHEDDISYLQECADELGRALSNLNGKRLRVLVQPLQNSTTLQEPITDSPIASTEVTTGEQTDEPHQANLPWLKLYNQNLEKFAEDVKPIEIAAAGTSLEDHRVARGTPATFEKGLGSYWLINGGALLDYLIPHKRFRFNENNINSIQVCFDFNQPETEDSPEFDPSQYDLSQFEVIYPAEVSQIASHSLWQLQRRGLLQFQRRES